MRSAKAANRLTQQAARQQIAVPPRARRIDQKDVEITVQAAVLKAVVKYQNLAFQLLHRDRRQRGPIHSL